MGKLWLKQLVCLLAIALLVVPSLYASAIPIKSSNNSHDSFETGFDETSNPGFADESASALFTINEGLDEDEGDWIWQDTDGSWRDFRDVLDSYRHVAEGIRHYETRYFVDIGPGFFIQEQVNRNRLRIQVLVGSYSIITYALDSEPLHALLITGSEVSKIYGHPTIPFTNLLYSLPKGIHPVSVQIQRQQTEVISGLSLIPGAEPLRLADSHRTQNELFFNEQVYSDSAFYPTEFIEFQEVGMAGTPGVLVNLQLMQYNPVHKQANLLISVEFDVILSAPVSWHDITSNPYEATFNGGGQGYVIIAPAAFGTALNTFVKWKQDLGFDVSIKTVESIYSSYPGRDHAEQLRNFISASYADNSTVYFLLVGDSDLVPTREVWDPYISSGLDNGTEPCDMYFECLDGDWDANGNNLFGETDDNVDFFPEVLVGRLPVQMMAEAQDVLSAIIQRESNPTPGTWMNEFLLIGPDCFGAGDGANMLEEELNQWFLYNSFFDVHTLYPTDGSLSNANVISRINTGVGIVDFFDHGWYGGWVDALDEESYGEVSGLLNGNKRPFAFAMACETAAFDVEAIEPTIGEAFFRNPNGGAVAYIGATRIAWAGYHAFDGLHNRFWRTFFDTALTNRLTSPKLSLQSALHEMVTTYSMSDPISLETVYQAIYFGDPSMHLYWKHNVTNTASQTEINEFVQVNGTCTLAFNNTPIIDTVNVVIQDPIGRIIYDNNHITNSRGEYTATCLVTELAGNYTVSTSIAQPFFHTTVNSFYVGNLSIDVRLDSTPLYHSFLDFSGTANKDGTGNASLVDADGNILTSKLFTITGGTYSDALNVTEFGWLQLFISLTNAFENGGVGKSFQVTRGDVLVIPDSSGGIGPDYPGGWADNNYGDSTNTGDYLDALKDEYAISIFRPRYDLTPSLTLLESFDAVIISVGDNYGYPLISPNSFLLDVLHTYHNMGGNLLLEGCQISTTLSSTIHNPTLESFSHSAYVRSLSNTGSLTLENTIHSITSGLPSTIPLLAGLGTPYADVVNPINGSSRVSGYIGQTSPASAITALTSSATYGGFVYFAFSIDAIENQNYRNLLIQNAVAFLLQPSLEITISDDALQTGSTETITVEVREAATSQPIQNANVTFEGCGVARTNQTLIDGTCSLFIVPTSEGIIHVSVTKFGFLNITAGIIVYDMSPIAIETDPTYLRKYDSQELTIRATDFYEHFPLDNCEINVTGCGVSTYGNTNSSGLINFTISPTSSGLIFIHANLTGYINTTTSIGVRIIAVVLPSAGTEYPSAFCWDEINLNWQDFGEIPIFINYTAFSGTNTSFTLEDLEEINADVMIIPYLSNPYSSAEIDAIITYIRAGHGLFVTSIALYYHSVSFAPLLGLSDSLTFTYTYGVYEFDILQSGHPLFTNLPNPFTHNYGLSFYPIGTMWDSSVIDGATYLALDTSGYNYGAVLAHRGMIYTSHCPELESNRDDTQLVYNALAWSQYVIPDHELRVTLDVPSFCEPGATINITATVINEGLNNETNLLLQLFIDHTEVTSDFIPELGNFTRHSLSYLWTPTIEAKYNITAYVAPVPGEYDLANNYREKQVNVFKGALAILNADGFDRPGYWTGGWHNDYMSIYNGLITEGFPVILVTNGDILSGVLASVDVIIMIDNCPNDAASEIVREWCHAGGNILTFDSSICFLNWAGILPPESIGSNGYNVYWDYGSPSRGVVVEDSHPIMTGYSYGETIYGTSGDAQYFSSIMKSTSAGPYYNPLVKTAIGSDFDLIVAYESGSSGNVVQIWDASHWQTMTNHQLISNAAAWLIMKPDHELSAGVSVPLRVIPGETTPIIASVRNRGQNNETNVTLQLFINESLIEQLFIPQLLAGQLQTITYDWTPLSEGNYNITSYVIPVSDEYTTLNNIITRFVNVRSVRGWILWDNVHGNDPLSFYSLWISDIMALGCEITEISSGSITSTLLEDYNVLICAQPSLAYSPSERSAIQSFVMGGGGLLVIGDDDETIFHSLTQFAGIGWESGGSAGSTTDITPHPVTEGVASAYFSSPLCRLIVSGEAISLIRNLGETLLAASEMGLGHVLGIGDEHTIIDGEINQADNRELAINMISWLIIRYPHEVLVELDVPTYADPDEQLTINMTVWNRGTENETDLTLQLFINESLTDTFTIPELNSGFYAERSTSWTPISLGNYNITAYMIPVPLENVTGNNRDTKWIRIRDIYARVLYDRSHDNQYPTNFTIWFDELRFLGIAIDILDTGPIDSNTLIGYDGFISVTPLTHYTDSERVIIQSYVNDGGGLLVIGEWIPEICSTLTSFAGITFVEDWNSSTGIDITPHTITHGVSSLYIEYLGARLQITSPAMNLARTHAGSIVLAAYEDVGRVIGFTSSFALSDYRVEYMDNLILAVNMVTWIIDENFQPSAPILQTIVDIMTTPEFPVSWSESLDSDGHITFYQLQVAENEDFSTIYQTRITSDTTQNVRISSDGVYYLRVRSRDNEYRYSQWSNIISVTVDLENIAPKAPILSITTNNDGTITLTWTTATDVDGTVVSYLLQQSNQASFLFITGAWNITETSIIIANLPVGMNYFRVAAIDNENAISNWSNSCKIQIPGIPSYLLIMGLLVGTAIIISAVIAIFWLKKRRYMKK